MREGEGQSMSVLARLKNRAKADKIQLQQLLNLFCQEEFLRRVSQSRYKKNLVLKGGLLLYSMSGFTTRPTVDSDYLLKNHPNDLVAIDRLVREIISVGNQSSLVSLVVRSIEPIRAHSKYPGVRANMLGMIGTTKTPFSVDFGVGDVVIPSPIERVLPVLLREFEKPIVWTYSLESVIAEKLDAIITLMELTGRMKDFYDIYYLSSTFGFEGRKLQEAIYETLSNRATPYERNSVSNIGRLTQDVNIQKRWGNFCSRVLGNDLSFELVVQAILALVEEPFKAIVEEREFFGDWDREKGLWI